MAKKKRTEKQRIKDALYRARSDYKKLLKELETEGFEIDKRIKQELPEIPKNPTRASVKRIRSKIATIKKHAKKDKQTYKDWKKEQRKQARERKRSDKQDQFDDWAFIRTVFDELRSRIDTYANEWAQILKDKKKEHLIPEVINAREILNEWIDDVLEDYNKALSIAEELITNNPLSLHTLYSSENAKAFIDMVDSEASEKLQGLSRGINNEIDNNNYDDSEIDFLDEMSKYLE